MGLGYTKVRNYKVQELLDRVSALSSFKGFPQGHWILGVQSKEDVYNEFDDKFYLFKGTKFITVVSGTTNAGSTGLKHYDRYNKNGVLVVKTDEWYYGLWQYGLHKGKMPALRQVRNIKYFRDFNKNLKVEEIGEVKEGLKGINFHTVTYDKDLSLIKRFIGGWSTGCQVVNNVGRYYEILDKVKKEPHVTYCLIREF